MTVQATPAKARTYVGKGARPTKPGGGWTVVPGDATYGYSPQGHHGFHGYYGYYPYGFYPNWYFSFWGYPYCWGWPYFSVGWYGGLEPPAAVAEAYATGLAAVETDIKPKKADVRVDGALVGQARDYNGTWDVLWLSPGEREISFSLDGYMTLSFYVDVAPGGYVRFSERLQEGSGPDPRSTERPVGVPAVEATPDGGDAYGLRLAPGSEIPGDGAGLRSGYLTIEAGPADAAVYLDGEFLARADELARLHGALPVATGTHVIEVVRPGYRSQRVEVEVTAEHPGRVVLRLSRVAPADSANR